MRYLHLFFTLILSFCLLHSCLNLDSNMFNNNDDIEAYQFDDYDGNTDFTLDETYDVIPGERHVLDFVSNDNGDIKNIKAFYLGDISTISTDTVIMYCHGNTGNIDYYWHRIKLLYHAHGKSHYGIMAVDYRGFGLSEGPPTESGLLADVDVCLQWLQNNGLSDDRLIIYGFSLGSIPSVHLSASPRSLKPSKLLLEAPIGSIDVMAQDGSSLSMPASFYTNLLTDNINKIKEVNQPFFLIHGTEDDFLSYNTHGLEIYENHEGEYKELVSVQGADHGDVPAIFGIETYLSEVEDFIIRE